MSGTVSTLTLVRPVADPRYRIADDVDLVKGMPVGIQIVWGRFGEERAIATAEVIESLM